MGGKFLRRQSQAAWVGGHIGAAEQYREENEAPANVDGWLSLKPVEHMCFPPQVYPRGFGSASGWTCVRCVSTWMSDGTQIIGEYPELAGKDQAIGPLRWIYVTGPKSDEQIALEQDLYDWRSTIFYNARLLRRLIELNGGTWEDV